ncbi:Iron only hydrogenase large subunit, C-terminal domain containing protein [Histomonas meleagridis]|uniref:Iron only hydrogenase large subunit, C-terminal domain containing protein n=1 Tax=Histomonas meleagridis TaxID=135588 RepID=UPI00355949FD|nr:Iron only hydrogenase large subunit, C-terminal domain containing protein [Histomonas meleagridis]KAH0806881.1 Iron only hydrogenase large subunit, C-terminal domain containing protein [Histomonas meleagridis]
MSEIVVAYGTTRGAAGNAAKKIASNLGIEAVTLNDLSNDTISNAKYGIFVISTIGNGQYPVNSKKFAKRITDSLVDLSKLKFALLGLGSSYYQLFCRAGDNLFTLLKSMGAQPFLPYVKSDRCEPDYGTGKIEKFINDVTSAMNSFKNETNKHQFQIEKVDEAVQEICPKGFKFVPIIEKEVLSDNYSPTMHKYTLQLLDGMTYNAGDQILIMPENDSSVVNNVLTQVGLDGNIVLKITSTNKMFPKIISIKQLFTQYIDLNCRPDPDMFAAFDIPFDNEVKTMAEFLLKYPHVVNPLEKFLSLAEVIVPRSYSVASEREGSVDLVVVDVFFGFDNGYYGLATHFLQLETTTQIAIRIIDGSFEYPSESSTPLIITALGSGIAPVLSLLDHRRKGNFGPCLLFFGVRSRKMCQPIIDLLAGYEHDGVIDKLYLAVSREEDKVHVTNLMKANTNELWKLWQNTETHFYYCGPENSAQEDIRNIMINVAVVEGKMTRTNAVQFWSKHKWNVEAF